MDKTARQEMEEAVVAKLSHALETLSLDENRKKLGNEDLQILAAMKHILKHHGIHWLHVLAFSLCPKEKYPQTACNLAAGPDYINFYMMTLEGVARRFAKQLPGQVNVTSQFIMLHTTDVVKEILFAVAVKKDNREITVKTRLAALALSNRRNTASFTDGSQIMAIMTAGLEGIPPSQTFTINLEDLLAAEENMQTAGDSQTAENLQKAGSRPFTLKP